MSKNLKTWLPILSLISSIRDSKVQKYLLKYFSKKKKFKSALREITRNIIKGNVLMSKHKRYKLSKNRKILYSIAYDKNDSKVQKNIIQSGGSLFYIIPLLASLLMK